MRSSVVSTANLYGAEQAVAGSRLRNVLNRVDGDASGVVVQSGSVSGGLHVHLPAPIQAVDAGRGGQVRKLPADTGLFVGRESELIRLEDATCESDRVVVVAVHGLGGVGKSALAAQFAHLHAERFAPVWWVTADSATAIGTGLADLAAALDPASGGLPVEQRLELAVEWLSSHAGWLLILDNLTAPADAQSLLERIRTGTILITSRHRSGWRNITTLSLDVLTPTEAGELLDQTVRADWPDADLDNAERLCAELGWLPLAIEQAGAYLTQTRITPARYLELLAKFPVRMFTATAEGGDAQRTMARVWHVTLDRLTDTSHAGQVLRELAWYASDDIPRTLLEHPEREPEVAEALGQLAAYNMITLAPATISVHRLVQAVTRTPDPDDVHRRPDDIDQARDTTAATLARVLVGANSRLPADWRRYQIVLPHAFALLTHTAPGTDTEPHCFLANALGSYLGGQGNLSNAIAMFNRAADSYEHLHGSSHPSTLTSRNNLAGAYKSAGDLAKAIPLYETTLADSERVLGTDHPTTKTIRSNLDTVNQR